MLSLFKMLYIYVIWYLTSIHLSKVILDSHLVMETYEVFSSLCSWWFSCQRQGTSPTLKTHLNLPHPSQAVLAAKGICAINVWYSLSIKILVQLNFTWLLNWKAKKQKRFRYPYYLWPSVTSTFPIVNLSNFA